jgi:hypothetical protein
MDFSYRKDYFYFTCFTADKARRSVIIKDAEKKLFQMQLSRDLVKYLCTVIHSKYRSSYTVKKVSDFPVHSRDVTNQTLPGR